MEGIDNKIRTSLVLLSSKKINLEKEKEQFNPKGFIDRLRKNLFNTNFTPEKLRLELNNVAICIDKLKSTTNKSFLIRTKNMSNTTHSHFELLETNSFSKINNDIKDLIISNNLPQSLRSKIE